jgi:molybdenum cofactor synthesis domain-containing protein
MGMIAVGILTVSDTASRGGREDLSGAAIKELVAGIGGGVVAYQIVPDEADQIAAVLREWADDRGLDLILTTGGTGLSPRDVTPEATRTVLEREIPGMAEAMRAEGLNKTPRAMLSRALVGTRKRSLVVNLPGSPKGVRESLGAILEVLPHALEILQARPTDH